MIQLLKCMSQFCWCPNKVWTPLSDLIILTLPLHPTNLLKLMMNESVLREYTTSMCMALLDRQVYRASYLLTSFWASSRWYNTSRWYNWPNSYILSPKNLRTLFGSLLCLDQSKLLVNDTSVLPTQQFCRIMATTPGVASNLPLLTF